ncbi:MAG: response regulator [Elusimicrobiales bacterium]|nr:response regulator [Elusimicrobiales bacterium]
MNIFGFGRKKPLVLVVDDDPMVGELTCDLLDSFGCDKLLKDNGREALLLAEDAKPDLILLDMVMPAMNGLSVLRFLKENTATVKIPVIMLTGEKKVSDIDAAFTLGAEDYIMKPAVRREFEEKIRKVLVPKGYSFAD